MCVYFSLEAYCEEFFSLFFSFIAKSVAISLHCEREAIKKNGIEPHGQRYANFQKEKVLSPTNCWSSSHKAFSPILTDRMLQNCFHLCRKRPELVLRITSLHCTNQCKIVPQRERITQAQTHRNSACHSLGKSKAQLITVDFHKHKNACTHTHASKFCLFHMLYYSERLNDFLFHKYNLLTGLSTLKVQRSALSAKICPQYEVPLKDTLTCGYNSV